MPPDTRLTRILEPVQRDLALVTDRLAECLHSPIAKKVTYLVAAGGKRLRPALVLLAGHSGAYRRQKRALVDLATAAELIHTATLIHDDIIDGAALRRKQPTFHERFGTERAVLMGDYLYAVAFDLIAGLKDSSVTAQMAKICQQLSRGEFCEVDRRFDLAVTRDDYLKIVRDKTASLIAACGQLGAEVAGAPRSAAARIRNFGLNFGMAFQIMDDCLDLIGEEQQVGKTLRSDLDQGSLSLPVIYLAQSLSSDARKTLFAPLQGRSPDEAFKTRIAQMARRSGAIERARETAEAFLRAATRAVALQDGVAYAETYHQLARYAMARTH